MTTEVVLLSTYSIVLLAAAQGLRALGRRSTSPWASRTLAGHLRATQAQPEPLTDDDWPHSEVGRLYAGIALVAALAGAALSVGSLSLRPRGALVALPLIALGLSALTMLRMARSLRSASARRGGAEGPALGL